MTKTILILILLAVLETSFTTFRSVKNNGRWVVEKTSSLSIQGETNVNKFQCDASEYLNTDTLFYASSDGTGKLLFSNSTLRIEIRKFDCHSRYITNDFRSALKADKEPELKISFVCLDQFTPSYDYQAVKGLVDIQLADIVKRFAVCYSVRTMGPNKIALDGSQDFTFSDFNLKAPKKLAGMIRTKEKIKVNFHLFFKEI